MKPKLTPKQEERIAQLAQKIALITAEPEYSVHARILRAIQLLLATKVTK